MTTKHTPGPWWANLGAVGGWSVKTFRDGEPPVYDPQRIYGAYIAMSIGDHTEQRTSGNEEANARLIAAAPDLLEALERLAMQVEATSAYLDAQEGRDPELLADYDNARAAIAKARGA